MSGQPFAATADAADLVDELIVECDGPVVVMTINRPRSRNAITAQLAMSLGAAMHALDARDDLAVGILTGSGGTFCAGMDLKQFLLGERPITPTGGFAGFVSTPPRKPLIAAVEGHAIAGGFEMVLACDLVVASQTAVFALPEVRRGLTAAAGGLVRLPRRVPYHLAMRLALTGEDFSAEQAAAAGLVSAVTAPGAALASARVLAAAIAANAPLAVQASKRVISQSAVWPDDEIFSLQAEIVDLVRTSDDAREGAQAFLDKRVAVWSAR